MRHKYETRGIVLARMHAGEATTLVTCITPDLGLVHARAQSLRTSGAKLSAALPTFAESSVMLVRGKEGWRLAGAVLEENWFRRLAKQPSRVRAARVSGLFLRLVAGEAQDMELFSIVKGFFEALSDLPEEAHESAEILAVLRLLAALGFDTGEIPGEGSSFAPDTLMRVAQERTGYIARINHGIAASGL